MNTLTSVVAILSVLATSNAYVVNHAALRSTQNDMLAEYKLRALQKLEAGAVEICGTTDIPDFEGPLDEGLKRFMEIDLKSETICQLIKNHFEYVMDPLAKTMDECLTNGEKGLVTYATKAVVSAVDFICKSDGEHIFELMNPCIMTARIDTCISSASGRWDEMMKSSSSFAEETCQEYADVKPCFEKEIYKNCELTVTREALMGLLDSFFYTSCRK